MSVSSLLRGISNPGPIWIGMGGCEVERFWSKSCKVTTCIVPWQVLVGMLVWVYALLNWRWVLVLEAVPATVVPTPAPHFECGKLFQRYRPVIESVIPSKGEPQRLKFIRIARIQAIPSVIATRLSRACYLSTVNGEEIEEIHCWIGRGWRRECTVKKSDSVLLDVSSLPLRTMPI